MNRAQAYRWFIRGETLAWRSLFALTLFKAGARFFIGSFVRPLTSPARYIEYQIFEQILRGLEPGLSLLDIGSPKLFSVLLAQASTFRIVATDIYGPAVDEAVAISGGLTNDERSRLRIGIADIREQIPKDMLPTNGEFDGAFSMSVIEHIEPDPGGDVIALDRIAAVVRRGGQIVISLPVDWSARSEFLHHEMYGRRAEDPKGRFFQRIYDTIALERLCLQVASSLRLESCTLIEWPDDFIMRMSIKYPITMGFAGILFPLVSPKFKLGDASPFIPEVRKLGDAVLTFRRI